MAVLKGAGDSETGVSNFTGLAVSRQLHLRAILAARTERHAVACRHLSALREQFPDYYYSRPETQILEAFCLFETESFEEAARLSGTLCATNPNALPPVQLHKFADLIRDENRAFDPSNVCWAILASALRSDDHESVSLDRVHDFVSDFIESQGCTVPTELLDKIGHNLDAVILSFFRDCCRPEIMESSIWIESQQELYQERLQLCERIKNGIDIALGIEGEIGSLMRKLAVIDITQRIERGKIFVDVEKICERTPDAQRDTIRRLLSIVAIRNNEVKQGLKLLGMPDREGGKLVVVSVDNGKELFRIAFEKIMEQYLFSPELGLDANLSQSIRHGPIIGGIRAIFDKFRLVTRKTSEGQYAENTHWKSLLSDSEVEGRAISSAFAQFTFEVDDFIRDVRLNRIQIRCSASPNGALDYDFTEQELGDIYNRLEPFHDVNDAIGVMLSALSDRTSFGLLDVQRQIMSQWNEHLQQMLYPTDRVDGG